MKTYRSAVSFKTCPVMISAWQGAAFRRKAFTLLELLIVAGIIAVAVGAGMMSFRETSNTTDIAAKNLVMSMQLRDAADQLTREVIEGTEIISPAPGSSNSFAVFLDLNNFTRVFYLEAETEREGSQSGKTYSLMRYTDTYEGRFIADQKKKLFGKIRSLVFTPVTTGLVQAQLTLVNESGKEIGTIIELSLKNVSSAYD